MRSMEILKQLIRPFCKRGKYIMYHNFGRSYRSGKRFIRPLRFVRPWTRILKPVRIFFYPGTPNGVKQGVPKTCFRVPSENPADL